MFEAQQQQMSGLSGAMAPYKNWTVTERLRMQKAELEERLVEINSVLAALESNPEIQQVVDALSKIRGI